jgi:integrase
LQQGLDGRDALLPDMSQRFELPNNLLTPLQEYLFNCTEKGNRQSTIDYKNWICNRFLKNLLELGCAEIHNLIGEQVQAAFLALGSIRYWERIGPFLRFLADSNYLKQNYSGIIQRRRNPMPQPTVYSPEEINIIEDSFDLLSTAGIRNYAITLLMSRYGIRACDVAALTFDNIDFENNRLHFIQQKTGDLWEGELFPEIKSALQRYIDNVRPNNVRFGGRGDITMLCAVRHGMGTARWLDCAEHAEPNARESMGAKSKLVY